MKNLTLKNKIIIGLVASLVILYGSVMYISYQGWGYPGHKGNYHSHSRFYWGGFDYYPNQSVRNAGSVTGGGPHGGK